MRKKTEKKSEIPELEIVYMSPDELTPYENNARKHAPDDIDQIKESILVDGFLDPIGVWGENNLIVEGHGRQIAAKELKLEKVPVIRLDHLTDDQRRDYAIRHNRTAELSSWDFAKLEEELAQLEIEGHDFSGLNFEFELEDDSGNGGEGNPYTPVVNIPQYEPSGKKPSESELVDLTKMEELLENIEKSDLKDEIKEFLKIAAYRHAVIDFDKVADYYAESEPEVQRLMEESALVIIDVDNAIANGYATLSKRLDEMMEESEDDE